MALLRRMPEQHKSYKFPVILPANTLKGRVKFAVGWMVLLARPGLRRRLRNGAQPADLWQICAVRSLLWRMGQRGDQEGIARIQRAHWASAEVIAHHEGAEDRFEMKFMGVHHVIVGQLLGTAREAGCHTLCEIGCGTGRVLAHFAEQGTDMDRFIGIDLSDRQTEVNREKHRDPRMEFVAGDAVDWIGEHGSEGWAFLCYGGVLEYFLRARLEELLGMLAQKQPVVFGLVEPVDRGLDLETGTGSKPHGRELTLSHPYLRIFREAGFQVSWHQEVDAFGERFIMMVARA